MEVGSSRPAEEMLPRRPQEGADSSTSAEVAGRRPVGRGADSTLQAAAVLHIPPEHSRSPLAEASGRQYRT